MSAPHATEVLGLRWERWSWLIVVAVWALVRVLQLNYLGWGTGFDVGLYQQYGQTWGAGSAAYVDFSPEYPPGALPIFLLPLLWGGAVNYSRAFAYEMACFDLLACLMVLRCAELRGGSRARPVLLAALYTLITAALFPVLYTRFDLVPGALVVAAIYCLHSRRMRRSGALLGVAGAVKLWPFALVPMWLVWGFRRRKMGGMVEAGVAIGGGALAGVLLVLPRAGWDMLSFLKYHAARGIQIETTWSTIALLLNRAHLAVVHAEHNFGAFHVEGRVPKIFAAISMPLTVIFALAPQVLATVRGFRRGENADRTLDYAVFAGAAGFMIAGKVLSPQFMLWIAPLLPLVVGGVASSIVALVMAVLTTVVYPYLSPALEQLAPGHDWALLAVGSRNLLLIGWYWFAMYRASGGVTWPRRVRVPSEGAAAADLP